jgi:tetraacyldisaccharide 4'-kinase
VITIINRARRALYRAGVLRARRLPVPVISIGNIGMGGGGKTPAVIAIAQTLTERGVRVGILTRGYSRAGEGGVVDSNDAARFGDEPVLIKSRVPDAIVIVGAKRYDNAIRYSVRFPCDAYLLDDGFQHMQIARDLDIVIDGPSRFARESRSALRFADIVIPRELRLAIPASLRGKRVFAFAGLADNEQFFDALRSGGLNVVGTRGFRDHHRYSAADIAALKQEDAEALVTTEKDAVKIADPSIVTIRADMVISPDVMERIISVAMQ